MRSVVLAVVAIAITGCTGELRRHTERLGNSIIDLQSEQIYRNIGRFVSSYNTLPSQYEIGSGTSAVNSTLNLGANPAIAFRALAFTGINVSLDEQWLRSWGVSPVTNVTALSRLRILYQYAVGLPDQAAPGSTRGVKTYAEFLTAFGRVGNPTLADGETEPLGMAIQASVGRLPASPLVDVGGKCDINPTKHLVDGYVLCFRDEVLERAGSSGVASGLSAQEIEARFILWSMAATQIIEIKDDKKVSAVAGRSRSAQPVPDRAQARNEQNSASTRGASRIQGWEAVNAEIVRRPDSLVSAPLPFIAGSGR